MGGRRIMKFYVIYHFGIHEDKKYCISKKDLEHDDEALKEAIPTVYGYTVDTTTNFKAWLIDDAEINPIIILERNGNEWMYETAYEVTYDEYRQTDRATYEVETWGTYEQCCAAALESLKRMEKELICK